MARLRISVNPESRDKPLAVLRRIGAAVLIRSVCEDKDKEENERML